MKTTELKGAALDWAVAKANGVNVCIVPALVCGVATRPAYPAVFIEGQATQSLPRVHRYVSGVFGDDIIDREGISVIRCGVDWCIDAEGFYNGVERTPLWAATFDRRHIQTTTEHQHHEAMYQINVSDAAFGATRREAAMRCFCAGKLGAEITIPDELK